MKLNGLNILEFNISNNIRTRSLFELFITCEFQESLYNPFIFGNITILDTVGIIENFPIIGNEKITLKYQLDNPDTSTTINFVIYKVQNENSSEDSDNKKRIITFFVCSELGIQNKLKRISKRFNATPDNILNSILTHLGNTKQLQTQKINDDIDFISNYWNAGKIVQYLVNEYKTNDYNDFIFFETTKSFYFLPLSYLLELNAHDSLTFNEDFKFLTSYSKIKYYNQKKFFNILELADKGFFGKTRNKFSYETYGIQIETKTLSEAYEEFNTLGSGNIFSELDSSNCFIDFNDSVLDSQSFARTSQNLNHFEIKVNGEVTREVGQLYSINFKTFDNEQETNVQLSGKWLSHTMKHILKNDGTYEQNILLTKNAYLNYGNGVSQISEKVYK